MENDDVITRQEHEEFRKTLEVARQRLEDRIQGVEEGQKQLQSLALSVERLACSMEQMAKEQKDQGEKLERLESRDGEMWRKVAGYIITAIAGIIIGFIFKRIGM